MARISRSRMKLSFLQILGMIMMTAGLGLFIFTGANAVMSKNKHHSSSEISANNNDAQEKPPASSESSSEYNEDAQKPSSHLLTSSLTRLTVGGLLILFAVPLFYAPKAESVPCHNGGYDDDEDDETDSEFDYPDDDFDYILDEEIRQRLLDEKRRKIKEMKKRRRRFLGRKHRGKKI